MDIKEGAMPGQNRLAFKKRQSLPNDQEVTFPELEPMFVELDEVVKRFGTLPGWGGGDQARWSSISGFPEQVYRFTPPRPQYAHGKPMCRTACGDVLVQQASSLHLADPSLHTRSVMHCKNCAE